MTERSKPSINVKPLQAPTPEPPKKAGRPAKLIAPQMPDMPMEPIEKQLFHYFIESFHIEYPDLTPTDNLLLFLAATEFIKYLRVTAEELESHTVISMARQHPSVNMRALLDQLSVTRKARNSSNKPPEDERVVEAKNLFRAMSSSS